MFQFFTFLLNISINFCYSCSQQSVVSYARTSMFYTGSNTLLYLCERRDVVSCMSTKNRCIRIFSWCLCKSERDKKEREIQECVDGIFSLSRIHSYIQKRYMSIYLCRYTYQQRPWLSLSFSFSLCHRHINFIWGFTMCICVCAAFHNRQNKSSFLP